MNEEFKKSLNKFLEKETYIVAYRSNYDSAREFNNELINYIKQLQKQNTELKEQILLLKASEPMLEFAKQTYKDNWNKLKKFVREELKEAEDDFAQEDFIKVLDRMQELEGNNECI